MPDKPSETSRLAPQPGPRPPGPEEIPSDLKVSLKEQSLRVTWQNGGESTFAFPLLRRECPCATCREERKELAKNPLHVLKVVPTGATVVSAKLVGNYAIQFQWSDGHNTGIFDFRMLRAIASASESPS